MGSEEGTEAVGARPQPPVAWPSWLETATAPRLVSWALATWGRDLAIGTALQAEGVVLIHLAWSADPGIRVFTIDTGRLPPETHEMIERVRDRFGIEVEVFMPDPVRVEQLVRIGGPNLFRRSVEDRVACCGVRKVETMRRILEDRDAWMTGIRRDQNDQRQTARRIERDRHFGVVKINPLLDWSETDVWDYVRTHDLPYHPLYDRGYRSIGCAPCTRPTAPHEDARAGRWWWESEQAAECGLHWVGDEGGRERKLAGDSLATSPGDGR